MKKSPEKICKNCRLFDPETSECQIIVLIKGEKIKVPVIAEETCFFDQEMGDDKFQPIKDLKEVKMWVEDPETGEKCKEGVVKIEYPIDFFGNE